MLWAVLLSYGGFAFPAALALITSRTRDVSITARTSAFVQSTGFLVDRAAHQQRLPAGQLDARGRIDEPAVGVVDLVEGARVTGSVRYWGQDMYGAGVDPIEVRRRIGMVFQKPNPFPKSIYDNIAYGRPEASETEVIAAAKAAHVDRFVHTLPDGYDTRVDDDGGAISAGEKQLITIARAVLARPKVLVLDEATSAVDTRTELLIQQAMAELRRDRTCFIIAHRLSTIRDADLILVMDAGRIIERGTHEELLGRCAVYQEIVDSQETAGVAGGEN